MNENVYVKSNLTAYFKQELTCLKNCLIPLKQKLKHTKKKNMEKYYTQKNRFKVKNSVLLWAVVLLLALGMQLKAQTPSFEIIKPTSSASLNADFPYINYGPMYQGLVDFDGDEDLDILYRGSSSSSYFIYENKGSGDYSNYGAAKFSDYMGGNFIYQAYVFGDFNGDDVQDLISRNEIGNDSTKLYLGDGTGNYIETTTRFHGGEQCTLFAVDIDSDGDLDVFLCSRIAYTSPQYKVTIQINDGNGNFTEGPISLEADGDTQIGISEPFDGKKRNLVIIGSGFTDGLGDKRLYQYDGVGSYSLISDAYFSETPTKLDKIYFGDITGDGNEDIIFETFNRGLFLYENTSTTTYSALSTSNLYQLGNGNISYKVAVKDLNKDGNSDIIYSTGKNGSQVYLCDGTGNFTLSETFANNDNVEQLDCGDINGDGYPEFIERGIMNVDADLTQFFVNDGDGTFTALTNNVIKEVGNGSLHVADLNSDNKNDVLVFGTAHDSNTEADVYLNDGSGNLSNFGSLMLNSTDPSAIKDINRDGFIDILVGNKVYLNDGNAVFTQSTGYPFGNTTNGKILFFNADEGYAEDVLFTGDGITTLYRNFGDGTYQEFSNTGLVGFDYSCASAGDLDNDGDMDIVLSGIHNSGDTLTTVYLNNGHGFFLKVSESLNGILNGDVKIADLNNDHQGDIIIAGNGYQQVYLNSGTGNSFTLHQTLEGLWDATVTTNDIDMDGDIDFISCGNPQTDDGMPVTKIYLNNGNGTFSLLNVDLKGVQDASISFADLDDDYDMDLLISGIEPNISYVSRIYKNTSTHNTINKTVVVCDSYYFIDEFLYTSGNYSKTIATEEGETRTINLALTVGGGHDETVNLTTDGYYNFNGDLLSESGTYQTTFVSSTGCDSLVTLNLTINDYVAPDDYNFIGYELIQPDTTPQLGCDFFPVTTGGSQVFDIDGDGDNDYLCVGKINNSTSHVMGYINQGNGIFTWEDYHITLNKSYPRPTVLHGDLNGDNIDDLIISGERYKSGASDLGTMVYFWDADQGYVLQDAISLPSSYYGCIGMADFTGNNTQDILLGDYSRSGIYLYTNDGSGNFTESLITSFLFSWDMAISEPYDGGKRDILIADYVSGYKYLLYRFDSINFSNTGATFVATEGTRAQFADANNDGVPDAVISASSSKINMYMNDGSGTYTYSFNFDNNRTVLSQFKFIDLNKDNAAELVLDSPGGTANDKLMIYWNDGSGSFSSIDTFEIYNYSKNGGYAISTGDLNDDGYTDIFFNGADKIGQWSFGGLVNDQSGGLDELVFNVSSNIDLGDTKFEDIDGDDDPDMIVTGNNKILGPITELYTNDGTGVFDMVPTHSIDSLKYSSIALADVDGNFMNDLVIMGMNKSDSVITKLYTNTGGVFTESSVALNDVADGAVAFLHANSDDYLDLLTIGRDSLEIPQAFLYLNDGAGNFSTIESGIEGLKSATISIGDLNSDSFDDILLVGLDAWDYNNTDLYLSNGDGTFTLDNSNVLVTASDAQIVDVNGDQFNDIYLAGTGVQYIYVNDGSGHFSLQQELDNVSNSKAQFDDIDLDGDKDIIVSGQWDIFDNSARTCLYINDGNGNFTLSSGNLLQAVYDGSLHAMDVDGDYDKDLVLSGTINAYTSAARVYRNITCSPGDAQLYATSCTMDDFYGQTLAETGVYYHDITTLDGCNRTLALNFTFTGDEVVLDTTVVGDIDFNGEILYTSGQYIGYFTNDEGCDSIVTLNLTIDFTTDLDIIGSDIIHIYPNPANDFINIELPLDDYSSIAFIDMIGRTLFTESLDQRKVQIDISDLNKGTYILKINGSGLPSLKTLLIKD